jgi:tetratricopeptide (TPR) repeat protein
MEPLQAQDRRLDSWKEIAAFFDRDERTVKRWEKERALPVHRVPGASRGGVFAYAEELAQWLNGAPVRESRAPSSGSVGLADLNAVHRSQDSAAVLAVELPRHPQPILPEEILPVDQAQNSRSRWTRARQIVAVLLAILAVALAASLVSRRTMSPSSLSRPRVPPSTANSEAQELYLKGRYFWAKRTPNDLNQAVHYFASAIVKDPNYAPAYVGLADCYNLLREYSVMPSNEAFPRALAAAKKAVALDDNSAEAHNSLGFATYYGNWDAVTAEREFKRAIELSPNYGPAHHWYATFLMAIHRPQEALVEIEQARKLEPASAPILADKGAILDSDGQREQAVALLKQLESTEPSFLSPHSYLANIYFGSKDYGNFVSEAKQTAFLLHDEHAVAVATAAEKGLAQGGEGKMLERMLQVRQELYAKGESPAYPLAQLCALLHRKQDGIKYLADSYAKRETQMLASPEDPSLSSLQGEPAFEEMIKKVKRFR